MSGVRKKTTRKPVRHKTEDSRRVEILEVASPIFARYGYQNTDVQVIADELNIGKGTIYRMFHTKQDLFLACVDLGMERALSYAQGKVFSSSRSPLERLKSGIRAFLEFFEQHPGLVPLFIIEMAEFRDRPQSTFAVYREKDRPRRLEFVQDLIDLKLIKPFPPRKLTDIIGSLLYGTIFTQYFSGDKQPLTDKAEDIIEVVINGMLLSDPGQKTP